MKKVKHIIHIIKLLKIALDVKTIVDVDNKLTTFYKDMGVI